MRILKALLILLILSQVTAAQSRYVFSTMGTGQGLSSDDIWSINQDKYGFIWIATTNGLNRYDGHSIKQYFHSETDKHSLAGNTIYWIFRDSDGDMWFACGAGGLSRYNYLYDNFESLSSYDSIRKFNKFNAPIWRFGEDHQKRIYLSSGEACYRYDKRSGKFEDLTPFFNNQLSGGIGRFLMDIKNPNLMWIAADNGLYLFDLKLNQIKKINFDVDKLGYGSPGISDIEYVSDNELLGSVGRAGYLVINTQTQQISPAEDAFNPAKSHRFTQMGDIFRDSHGRIWMANSADGLLEYNPPGHVSYSLKKEPGYPYPFPEQEGDGKALFEDRDGNIWYGTSTKGIVLFQPQLTFISVYQRNYADPSSLPGNKVTCFIPINKDQVLIGTDRGLTRMDISANKFNNYPYDIGDKELYPAPVIHGMERSGDSVYITTNNGLSLFDIKTEKFSRYLPNTKDSNSLFDNVLWLVHRVAPGELIITADNAARFELKTGRCFSRVNAGSSDPLYSYTDINASYFDKDANKLWIESNKAELYEYDLSTKQSTRHQYTTDTSIRMIIAITRDIDRRLWIGTTNGLIQYDPITHQGKPIALPGNSKWVTNIIPSGTTMWITTASELIKIDIRTGSAESFDIRNVLPQCNTSPRAAYFDDRAHLWIGTTKGFCVVDTLHYKGDQPITAPRLVSFSVFDKERRLERPGDEPERIILGHQENFFSISFSSFSYRRSQGIQYAYKLSGFDKDWNYTSSNKASYTNVPPGNYTLMIKGSNGVGGWQEMKQNIMIRVKPPFWLSWPFVTICAIALVLVISWLYFRRKKQQQKENIDKTIDYFANSVYGENSVNEICWDIARNSISQLDFEDCVVYLINENGKLVQKAAYGPKNPKGHEIENPLEIEIGKGIVGTVAQTGKPLLISDTTKDSRYIVDDEIRLSELAVPILHDGKVIGVIDSEHHRKNFFTPSHLKTMTTIASISSNKIAEAQAEENARQHEMKLLEINKMLAESQLMALRAQMNPHFVFNCLNSIQECIVTQKYGEASNYLNKFSKLFRMVLNNSGKNLVSLEEEKEVLQLYLELEQMRFEKSFSFEIKIDEDLDTDEILIPSMLIQPYAENALWHGLMHKDGKRILTIEFKKINEDVFSCIIDDNGIGRKRSFELKEGQSKAKRHESKGLKISMDRIDVLQKQGYHARLDIIDKTDAAGEPEGTRVVIELSTYLKN